MEYMDTKKKWIKMTGWMLYWSIVLMLLLGGQAKMVRNTGSARMRYLLVYLGTMAVLCAVAGYTMYRSMHRGDTIPGKRKKTRAKIWHYLLLFAEAVFSFTEIESINNPSFGEMQPGYMALNIAIILVLLLALFLLLNSLRLTLMLWTVFYYVLSLVFYYVYLFRGEPFQFIDIYSVGTAAEVAGGYQFGVTGEILLFTVLTLCLLPLFGGGRDYCVGRTRIWKVLSRVGTVGVLGLLYYLYLNTGWNGDVGILTDLYRPYKTYQEYGTTTGFLCVAKYMRVTAPEGYSEAEAKKIAEDAAKSDNLAESAVEVEKPVNIIAIMNESWADYRYLGDFETTAPYMEYYDSLTENTIKGHTLVCIRGGGTAKTEYEFLTGNSVKRFPGMVPYVSYFTHDQYSLVSTLEAQGYQSLAMHPNKGSNWKRTSAYRLLGFDDFMTIDDFDASALRIRQHISDQANYEKIIDVINAKEKADDPFFLFDVTMQNHGGYTDENYVSDVETVGYTDSSVNQYLSLLRDTDDALRYLIEYFKNYDEPTMIVMFGDHYPDLPDSFTEWITGKTYDDSTLAEQEKYYATPFFIWANYDIPEADGILTSTNYLSTLMLEQTGLAKTPYNNYLAGLQKQIPALNHLGYENSLGEFTAWDDADAAHEKLEQQYEILQYNELTETSNRLDQFFLPATP